MIYLPISFGVTSLALGQSDDCPSASEATLENMGKFDSYLTTTKHTKARTVCIIHGTSCIFWNRESQHFHIKSQRRIKYRNLLQLCSIKFSSILYSDNHMDQLVLLLLINLLGLIWNKYLHHDINVHYYLWSQNYIQTGSHIFTGLMLYYSTWNKM